MQRPRKATPRNKITSMSRLYIYHHSCSENRKASKEAGMDFLQKRLQAETGAEFPPRMARSEKGKPFLPQYPELCFNLSDSGGYIALVFSSRPIGIDLETISPRPYQSVLPRWFLESEYRFLSDSEPERELCRFIHLWTCKESLLKHIGCGLGAEMKEHPLHWRKPAENAEAEAYAFYRERELVFDSLLIQNGRIRPWKAEHARPGNLICTVCRQKDEAPVSEIITLKEPAVPKERF